jgi:diguanylate cyclase (GGDEF)-like protein
MIILATTLLLISIMMTGMTMLAWASFGRPAHAFTWSMAFTLFAVNWGIRFLDVSRIMADPAQGLICDILVIAGSALTAIGFRERSRLPAGRPILVIITLLTSGLAAWFSLIIPFPAMKAALPLLFVAISAGFAAQTLTGRRASERVERGTRAALLMLAAYNVALGALGLMQGLAGGDRYRDLLLDLLMVSLPAISMSVGVFTLFLMASDLASHMRQLAVSDPLTGILNRRGFEQEAAPLLASARRRRRPVTMVMADIDRFKSINDTHGHAAGDRALRWFADQLGTATRRRDLVARVGGEEFAIILADVAVAEAQAAIELVQKQLHDATPDGLDRVELTASFGIAGFDAEREDDLPSLMGRADRALYRAKDEGRDRICLAQ